MMEEKREPTLTAGSGGVVFLKDEPTKIEVLKKTYRSLLSLSDEMGDAGFSKNTDDLINSLIIEVKLKIANEICETIERDDNK